MSTPIHRLHSALPRLLDPTLLQMVSTLRHPRSRTTSALVNFLRMACPQAVLAEEVAPTRHHLCLTLRPSQGLTALIPSLFLQTVLPLKPRHTNAGRVEEMMIPRMMMMNLTRPQLLEVVTPFPAIRKKFHFLCGTFFIYKIYNLYLGAVKLFGSSASNQSNVDVTSSEKVMHVSRKPSLRRTRRQAKSISLIEVCFVFPTSWLSLIDGFLNEIATSHIKYLEAVKDQLEARLKGADHEVHRLRNVNEALMLNRAGASNLTSPPTFAD